MNSAVTFPAQFLRNCFDYEDFGEEKNINKPSYSCSLSEFRKAFASQGFALIKGYFKPGETHARLPSWLDHGDIGDLMAQNNRGDQSLEIKPRDGEHRELIYTVKGQPAHCDSAYHETMPDIVMLGCSKAASFGGLSIIIDIRSLLSDHHMEYLKERLRAHQQIDVIYSRQKIRVEKPFVKMNPNTERAEFAFTPFALSAIFKSKEDANLYDSIIQNSNSPAYSRYFLLEDSDFVILDNTSMLHGRTAFAGERNLSRFWFKANRTDHTLGMAV